MLSRSVTPEVYRISCCFVILTLQNNGVYCEASGKIVVLTGARQVGKTTLVRHVLDSRRVTMLNFDVPFDAARFKTAAVLPPADGLKTLGDPEYLVIDEAQREPDTAKIVKGWHDSELPVKIILPGSSALNLRMLVLLACRTGSEISVNEIASQLTMARQTVD